MINLLTETLDEIIKSGHEPDNIVFIGSEVSGHQCSWTEFTKLADIEYTNGYGGQEIANDLIIVFSDNTRLRREEYDGSEGWEFLPNFKFPTVTHPITILGDAEPKRCWSSLSSLQKLNENVK